MYVERDLVALEANKIVVHSARKPGLKKIAPGFGRDSKIVCFQDVGLRFFGPRPSQDAVFEAASSGIQKSRTNLGKHFKNWVLVCQYRWARQFLQRQKPQYLVVWNGVRGHRAMLSMAARELGITVIYFEDAPLPGRIAVDTHGVNYGALLPKDIEFYKNWCTTNNANLVDWKSIGQTLKARKATHNTAVEQRETSDNLASQKFLFFPLQVEGDSQITAYGDWIKSVKQSIFEVHKASRELPEGWHVRVKDHPSTKTPFVELLSQLDDEKFRVDNTTDTIAQVRASSGVITVNSSVGLQTFFYEKPVLTLGHSIYAFSSLAIKLDSPEELSNLLATPDKWQFDSQERNAFMTYLEKAQFLLEEDLCNGKIGIDDIVARDMEKQQFLARSS